MTSTNDSKDLFNSSRKFFFQNRVIPTQYGSNGHANPFPIASSVIDEPPCVSPTNHLYDWFLNFKPIEYQTFEVMNEYRSLCRFGANLYLAMFVCIPHLLLYFTQSNGLWYTKKKNQAFVASFLFMCIASIIGFVVMFDRLTLLSNDWRLTWLQRFYLPTVKRMKSPFSQLPEDLITVFAALAFSLAMLGRVTSGRCEPDLPIFYNQGCNPQAEVHGIPYSSFHIIITTVLFCQVFLKSSSRSAIVFSWALTLVVTNISLFLVGSGDYLFFNCVIFMFIAISYEIQRTSVCQFLGQKLMNDETNSRIGAENAVNEAMMDRNIATEVAAELQGTIANSAHDVKSPCTALTLGIESIYQSLLSEQKHRPSKANSDNLEITKEMFKILSLMESSTNRVKDLSKVTCTLGLVPTLSPLNIVSCMRRIIEDTELEGLINFCPPPPGFPEQGVTDAGWFKDNFSCVIQNALKYSSGQKIAINYSMVTDMGQDFVHICVKDLGQTLSTLRLLRLFDPPTQRHRLSIGGMGIGLVCLAERIKALGGDFGAEERDDMQDGNCVWFRIPFGVALANDLGCLSAISEQSEISESSPFPSVVRLPNISKMGPQEMLESKEDSVRSKKRSDVLSNKVLITAKPTPLITANPNPSITTNPTPSGSPSVSLEVDNLLRGLSILVVDDAASIVKMISFILTKAGAEVTQAKNGLEAVVKTKETIFDIVISDIQMPVLDGLGAVRGMREHERLSGSRAKIIIGISAVAEGNSCDDALAAGMNAFLPKPFLLRHLVETIKELKYTKHPESPRNITNPNPYSIPHTKPDPKPDPKPVPEPDLTPSRNPESRSHEKKVVEFRECEKALYSSAV